MKKPESMTEYMNLSTEDKMKLFRQETAPSSDTAQCDCSVCAAVRRELNNVAQYLDNAPHAEFERANV